MTRRLAFLDRVATLLAAAVLVTAGLVLIDWHLVGLLPLPDSADVAPALDVVTTTWFPWAFAGGALLVGLLALWWLLAHLPKPPRTQVRLESGDRHGSVRADLSSLANAAAERFARFAPVSGTSGSVRSIGGRDVVEVRATIDLRADPGLVHEAAARTSREVAASLTTIEPSTRVLLETQRRVPLRTRSGPSRVH